MPPENQNSPVQTPNTPSAPAESPTPVTPTVSNPKSPKKIILIIVAILVIILIAVALYFVAFKKKPSANSASTGTESSQSATKKPVVKTCLTPSDYDSLLGYSNDIAFTAESPYTDNVHFNPDSTEFDDQTFNKSTVDNFTDWYKKYKDSKEIKFTLEGSTNDVNADANSIKLAKARAEKVKADFVAGGVPANLIETSTYARKNDSTLGAQDRVVIIGVDPTCTLKQ